MRTYTIFYDPRCAFCAWCRAWLERRSFLTEVTFADCHGELARKTFAGTDVAVGRRLVVTSNEGEVFESEAAFHVVLSFLTEWHEFGQLLQIPVVHFFADVAFDWIEQNREFLGAFLRLPNCEGHCESRALSVATPPYR